MFVEELFSLAIHAEDPDGFCSPDVLIILFFKDFTLMTSFGEY